MKVAMKAIPAALCIMMFALAALPESAPAAILQIDQAQSVARSFTWNGEYQDIVEFPLSGTLRLTVTPIPKVGEYVYTDRIDFMNIDVNTDNGAGRSWTFPAEAAEFRPPNLTTWPSCLGLACPAVIVIPTFSGTYDGKTLHLAGSTGEPEAPLVAPPPSGWPSGWSYSTNSYTLVARRISTLTVTSDPSAKKPAKFNINGGKGVFRVVFEDAETPSDVVPVIASSGNDWITFTKAPSVAQLVNGKAVVEIAYTVARNPAAARKATVNVNGTPVLQMEQAGVPCKASLSSKTSTFEYYGGTSTVTYSVPEGCVVAATTDDTWVTLTPGENSVTVTAAEGGAARTAKINFTATHPETGASSRKVHTVVQKKRSGAGTVKPGEYSVVDSPEKAAKAAAAALFIHGEALGLMENLNQVSDSFITPEESPVRVLARATGRLDPLGVLRAEQRADSREDCPGGGSRTWSKSGNFVIYDNCRENSEERDGTISRSATYNAGQKTGHGKIVAGNGPSKPFTVTRYVDGGYSLKLETLAIAATATVDVKLGDVPAGKPKAVVTYSGSVDSTVPNRNLVDRKTMLDMQKFRMSIYDDGTTESLAIDGSLRAAFVTNGTITKVQEFAMKELTVSSHSSEDDSANAFLNGTFAINSYPDSSCIDGTFGIDTVTPLSYSTENGARGGEIVVNGIPVVIGEDGTGTATITGTTYPLGAVGSACSP